jgi:hypothetical protein
MSLRTRSLLAGVTLVLTLAGCGTAPPPEPAAPRDQAAAAAAPPPPPPPASQPVDSVFLVGDAGDRGANDEVLAALHEEVQEASAALGSGHVTVIFLGDNIYQNGLPDENGTPAFKSALALLAAQVDSANVNSGVEVYFVPGNHDWDHQGKRGLARIKRQTRELRKFGSNVEMLPGDGCPGPSVKTAGDRLQILFLDTQWWLHRHAKPAAADCSPGTEKDVTAAIEKALANAGGRFSILVAHHPLTSGGPHGTDRKPAANEQDQDDPTNLHMRTAIRDALKPSPPLAWASGHDHTLEVLQGGGAQFLLVSGAGNFGHTETTLPDPTRGTWLFPAAKSKPTGGYMRLDIPAAGAPSVAVITVAKDKKRKTVFSRVLTTP